MALCFMRVFVNLCLLMTSTAFGTEPQCSPFHYQEQLIEKMVKLEILVQRMKEDMDAAQKRVQERTERIEADMAVTKQRVDETVNMLKSEWEIEKALVKSLSSEIGNKYEVQSSNFTNLMEKIKGVATIPTIVFQAKGLANLSPSKGETLILQTVLLNEGNAYDSSTGKFRAPVNGIYLFTVQLCAYGKNKYFFYDFIADGTRFKGVFVENAGRFSCSTADAVTFLRAGSHVWGVYSSVSTTFHEADTYWNSFSGVLIH